MRCCRNVRDVWQHLENITIFSALVLLPALHTTLEARSYLTSFRIWISGWEFKPKNNFAYGWKIFSQFFSYQNYKENYQKLVIIIKDKVLEKWTYKSGSQYSERKVLSRRFQDDSWLWKPDILLFLTASCINWQEIWKKVKIHFKSGAKVVTDFVYSTWNSNIECTLAVMYSPLLSQAFA